MPKISDKKREDRRQHILEAALACFSDDGFHQTGMADIVKRSGLSHGAVYLYFQGKDDLIEALADDRHRREAVLNSVAQGFQAIQSRGCTRWCASMRNGSPIPAWTHEARAPRRRIRMQAGAEPRCATSPRPHQRRRRHLDMPRALIVALVERAQHDGLIKRDLGADAIARVLVAIFQGFVLQKCWGEDFDVAACMATVCGVIDGFRTTKPDIKRRTRT